MKIIVSYQTGRTAEALLLAANPDRIRIVFRRRGDTVELRRAGAEWLSDRGDRLTIEALIAPVEPPAGPAGEYLFEEVSRAVCWKSGTLPTASTRGQWSTM
jgi:hypothetical protein